MAHSLAANLPNITDRGLAEAFLAGVVSTKVDLGWVMFIPWSSATYDMALYAGPSGYAADTEGGDIATEAVDETYGASVRVGSFSSGYAVSGLSRVTMRPDVLPKVFMQLGALGLRFFASQIGGLLNACTTTTKTADGIALASASHPSDAGLQSNYLNGSLSPANYAIAVRMLMDQVDHRGNLVGGAPSGLIVPTDLDQIAKQIVGADFSAADDRTGINVYKGSARVITMPELTSATRWFLLDETQSSFRAPVVRGPNPWQITDDKSLRFEVRDKIYAGFGVAGWQGLVVG